MDEDTKETILQATKWYGIILLAFIAVIALLGAFDPITTQTVKLSENPEFDQLTVSEIDSDLHRNYKLEIDSHESEDTLLLAGDVHHTSDSGLLARHWSDGQWNQDQPYSIVYIDESRTKMYEKSARRSGVEYTNECHRKNYEYHMVTDESQISEKEVGSVDSDLLRMYPFQETDENTYTLSKQTFQPTHTSMAIIREADGRILTNDSNVIQKANMDIQVEFYEVSGGIIRNPITGGEKANITVSVDQESGSIERPEWVSIAENCQDN